MPIRMVDGDAIATSTRLNKVPEKYRLDYAYWVTFAQANGTFEADANIIWAKFYAYQFPSRKLKHVFEILSAFSEAGLIHLWQEDGKQWGFFSGSEKPGRLPSSKHLNRYKNLPPSYPGLVQDKSRTGPENVLEGVDSAFAVDTEMNRTDMNAASSIDSSSQPETEGVIEMKSSTKNFAMQLITAWHEIHGASAVVRLSGFDQAKKDFEFFVETHDKGLIIDAFKLWATEKGDPRNAFPLNKFLAGAAEYMQRVQPLAALEAKEKAAAEGQAASVERQTQEIIKKRNFRPLVNEASISDLD